MITRHRAAVAGLALALTVSAAPQTVFAAEAGEASRAEVSQGAGRLPDPADYDKADFFEEAPVEEAGSSSRGIETLASLSPVYLTDEMKYFTQFESHSNYDQGFSYGDGYNAVGYYQFDRRYSLVGFVTSVYQYDPVAYAMFAPVIARGSEVSDRNVSMYDAAAGRLSELGQLVEDAWHAAYAARPAEFSALQDAYAYNNYYAVSERWLANQGISLAGRADCVKGLVWSMTNLFGSGGVRDFFNYAMAESGLSNGLSDRAFVNALVDAVVNHIAEEYPNQPQYHKGWINRYEQERTICLRYIAEDEQTIQPSTPPSSASPLVAFTDYVAGSWYATSDDLSYTVQHHFMQGYSDGSGRFGFDDDISRADVVVVLWRLAGSPDANARNFADVDYSDYYGDAIEWARYVGIITGDTDAHGPLNRFRPKDKITREELATMLYKYAGRIGRIDTLATSDKAEQMAGWDEVPGWARDAMAWAVDCGVITGIQTGGGAYIGAGQSATRAQMGVMVARLHRDVL